MPGAGTGNFVRLNGGRDGFDGIERLSEAGRRLRAHDRAYPVSASRSSLAAAVLCVAGLRSLSAISRAATLPRLLAGKAGRAAAFGRGCALQADQAGGVEGDQRRVQAALILLI